MFDDPSEEMFLGHQAQAILDDPPTNSLRRPDKVLVLESSIKTAPLSRLVTFELYTVGPDGLLCLAPYTYVLRYATIYTSYT